MYVETEDITSGDKGKLVTVATHGTFFAFDLSNGGLEHMSYYFMANDVMEISVPSTDTVWTDYFQATQKLSGLCSYTH